MHRKQLTAVIPLGTWLLALAAVFALAVRAQADPPPLTPEQHWLVAEKARARTDAGQSASRAPQHHSPPDMTVCHSVKVVRTTKAEMLQRWQQAWATDQPYLTRLEREAGREAAEQVRQRYLEERRQIEALPDGPIEQRLPSVEVGLAPDSCGEPR
jgi:hypothetical protein